MDGALLPLLLMPAGVLLTRALDVFHIQWRFALPMLPIGMVVSTSRGNTWSAS